ncbi:MAG: alanine racemase [Chloroflexi bacterium]|nr:alanine racemase [Chloroflexota bacterium]
MAAPIERSPRMSYPSRVEIDLSALASNVRWLKARVGDTALMAVVKANAYGHGAPAVAQAALRAGADMLAVANLAEARELRAAGIDAPILVLSYAPAESILDAIKCDLILSVYDSGFAEQCIAAASRPPADLAVHVKVDTGMGRLGILPSDAYRVCQLLREAAGIRLEGIYTHFATADDDPAYMREQLKTFKSMLARIGMTGNRFKYIHAANSAALVNGCEALFNLVRPGILLYGLEPMPASGLAKRLKPVMSWKTQVAQVKTLPPDSPVGYGNAYRTRGEETIAVLPVGYADGLRRAPQAWREVLIHGRRAPLIGRVSMEKITVNVSHIPQVKVGDEAVLLGRQGEQRISADEIARWIGSNNYEVVTSIAPRVPRSFLNG